MKLKNLIAPFITVISLASCSSSKTVYVSNKSGNAIKIIVDSSYQNISSNAFIDSLNGLENVDKQIFHFDKGKWTKMDKTNLEEVLKHIKIIKNGNISNAEIPHKTSVTYIRLGVEELWVKIK